MVKVGVAEPLMPLPSLRLVNVLPLSVETCHCTLSGPVPPLSAMVKDSAAVWPTVAVTFCGCVVMLGAAADRQGGGVAGDGQVIGIRDDRPVLRPRAGRGKVADGQASAVVAPLMPEPSLTVGEGVAIVCGDLPLHT